MKHFLDEVDVHNYMESVAKLMRRQLRYDPEDIRARYALATSLLESEKYESALREYWSVLDIKRDYESGEALFASALCLAALDQHADALIYLHEGKALLNSNSDRYAIASSRSLAALRRFDEAEKLLRHAIENRPSGTSRSGLRVALLWVELGIVLYLNGVIDASDAAFFKASTYAPKSAEVHGRRALFYLEQDSLTEVKIPLERALAINPNEAYTFIARAEYYLKVGNRETAFVLLENIPSSAFRLLSSRKALFQLFEQGEDEFDLM